MASSSSFVVKKITPVVPRELTAYSVGSDDLKQEFHLYFIKGQNLVRISRTMRSEAGAESLCLMVFTCVLSLINVNHMWDMALCLLASVV